MKRNTLIRIYHDLNTTIFAGVLAAPRFCITRSRHEYASYVAGFGVSSIIYFNLRNIKGHMARSIVYHEMTHQYLEEYLGIEESNHHGEEFWRNYKLFAPSDVLLFEELD